MNFREITIEDIEMLDFYKNEFLKNNEAIHGALLLATTNTEEWIKNLELFKTIETTPKEFVPAHTFILTDEKKILGIINMRHDLNDYLFKRGGHIGYSVSPSERRKGYGYIMLKNALKFYSNVLAIDKVLLTCDSENIASEKTILKAGAILENIIEEENRFTKRFWINISN